MRKLKKEIVFDAWERLSNDGVTNKTIGFFILLTSLDSKVVPLRSYSVGGNFLEKLDSLCSTQTNVNTRYNLHPWCIAFSNRWLDFWNEEFTLPYLDALTLWLLSDVEFDDNYDTSIDNLIIENIGIYNISESELRQITKSGSSLEKIYNEIFEPTYTKEDLIAYFNDRLNKSNRKLGIGKSLSFSPSGETCTIAAAPSEITRGPFTQPLYSGIGIYKIFMFSQYNLLQLYSATVQKEDIKDESNTDIESKFKTWLDSIKKTTGEAYSENTKKAYITALKNAPSELQPKPFKSIFEYETQDEFYAVLPLIENSNNFREISQRRGNGAFPAGLALYQHFLHDIETESIFSELPKGKNILYYGIPGVGKSHRIKEVLKDDERVERITFHPDYTYGDFVGQLLPQRVPGEDKVTYNFVPGPFARILKKACGDPFNSYFLIIEEINRGNASAIFGDIFQLLDRDDEGRSKYPITNPDLCEYVLEEADPISIPHNLTIYATMNTCDQNVFVLDTAFKRRWQYRYIENPTSCEFGGVLIPGTEVTWQKFVTAINKKICDKTKDSTLDEDKQIGMYFISRSTLEQDEKQAKEDFADKVLMYLWNDVARFDKTTIFAEHISSFNELRKTFIELPEPSKFSTLFNDIEF